MPSTLSVSDCISFGWKTFKSRPWFFVGTIVIYAIVQTVLSGIQDALDLAGILISIIAGMLFYMGFLTLYLKAHDNAAAAKFSDFWNPAPFWNYLGISILLFLIVFVGLILLVVPGIIFALMFSFAGFLVVEKGMNPVKALKESARLTKGNRWKLFLLGLALLGLTILGMIPLFLGLLVVGPIAMFASIHAYRVLSGTQEMPAVSPAQS